MIYIYINEMWHLYRYANVVASSCLCMTDIQKKKHMKRKWAQQIPPSNLNKTMQNACPKGKWRASTSCLYLLAASCPQHSQWSQLLFHEIQSGFCQNRIQLKFWSPSNFHLVSTRYWLWNRTFRHKIFLLHISISDHSCADFLPASIPGTKQHVCRHCRLSF